MAHQAAAVQIIKRSGDQVPFDSTKIRSAIARAGQATGEFGDLEAGLLTSQSVKVIAHRFAFFRLILLTEVATAAFVALQCVQAHQFAKL